MSAESVLLVAIALSFAFSIGAHYTGACMGMPVAAGALRPRRALLLMAPLSLLGAVLASGAVETRVGHGLLGIAVLPLLDAVAILGSAFALTTLYNLARIPTSTIQIFVFSAVGLGLARGIPIDWPTVEHLVLLWAIAPVAAFALGLGLGARASAPAADSRGVRLAAPVAAALVAVGAAASFAMGANDVSNASGALLMTGLAGPVLAGLLGGIGLAVGVLTWGRPLLRRVAFDIVRLDAPLALAAEVALAAVILASAAFGYFTSMNQALVGALLGVGVARGRVGPSPVLWRTLRGILLGWAVGPASGVALAYGLALGLRALGG